MEETQKEVKVMWYKKLWLVMPSWMKKVFIVLSIVTVVYWVLWALYNALHGIRFFLHWLTDKTVFNVILLIIIGVSIGAFIYAQFVLGLDPIGKFQEWLLPYYEEFKMYLINLLP